MGEKGRDFSNEKLSDAWRRIVEKKGSPVPEAVSDPKKTKEQLLAYAKNCTTYLEHATESASDPARNSDQYWDAAALWWQTRIDALNAAAARRRAVPCPQLPHMRAPSNLKRTQSASCLPIPLPTKKPNLYEELMEHRWGDPIEALPLEEHILETSYAGKAWTTDPTASIGPGQPSYPPNQDSDPPAPLPTSLENSPKCQPTPSSKPSTDNTVPNPPELKGFLGLM